MLVLAKMTVPVYENLYIQYRQHTAKMALNGN